MIASHATLLSICFLHHIQSNLVPRRHLESGVDPGNEVVYKVEYHGGNIVEVREMHESLRCLLSDQNIGRALARALACREIEQ